jgi:hypothetical protein
VDFQDFARGIPVNSDLTEDKLPHNLELIQRLVFENKNIHRAAMVPDTQFLIARISEVAHEPRHTE